MISVLFADLNEQQLSQIIDEHFNYWSYYNPHMVRSVTEHKFRSLYCGRKLPYGMALFDGINLVGFCVLKERSLANRKEGPWITDALILKKFRRQYYGTRLVEEAIKRLGSHGYRKVYVWTDQASLFCRKAGFEYVATAVKDLSGEGDIYVKRF